MDGDPTTFSYIAPIDANNQLFIHPYLVNPNSEDHIFYPAGNKLFRNSAATLIQINQNNPDGTSEGWSELTNFVTPAGTIISTLAISATNPANVLYYASYSASQKPEIYRLSNANNSSSTSDLKVQTFTAVNSDSIPPEGAYIHDIAVSEDNGNEIIAVVSNYSTESIYYSTNGGNTWTELEETLNLQTEMDLLSEPQRSPKPLLVKRHILLELVRDYMQRIPSQEAIQNGNSRVLQLLETL